MKGFGRSFATALAISVAAHAAFLLAPSSRAASDANTSSAAEVIEFRVLEAGKSQAALAMKTEVVAATPPPDVAVTEVPRSDSSFVSAPPAPTPDLAASAPPRPVPFASAAIATQQDTDPAQSRDPVPSTAAEATSGLDRGPQPLDDIEPAFPTAAGVRGGVVTLSLVISAQGVVESVEVVASSPPGLFDAAAVAAFGQARFSPGLKAGVPVRSEIRYEVRFAPIGRGTDTSGRTY